MLRKIWQYIKRLFQQVLIIFPVFPQENSSRRAAVAPPRPTRTDAEYEAIFMQLLEEVDRGTSSGNVAGFLMVKGVKETELAAWLRQFGERLLAIDNPSITSHQELARRLVLLSEIRGAELGGVAGEFGRGILAKFPLPIVEEDWRGKVIEAVFVGDGLGNEEVNQEAKAWFERGNELLMSGDVEDAIVSYDQAIKIKPDLHEAWSNRGFALVNLRLLEEAIASFDKAIEFKPNFHDAWNNRGSTLVILEQIEEAIISYDKAIEIKPDYHDAWYNRGVALHKLGRFEKAIASLDKAIEIKPDYHDAWFNRGSALGNLGQFEEALASWDKTIEFKSDYHEAWNNRGSALVELGQFEEAITSYDKAIEFKLEDHDTWNNRGVALKNLGQFEEAIASFKKAIEIKPDKHYAWYCWGVTLDDLGRFEEALASFDKAIEFKPDFHEAWYNQGNMLGNLGRFKEALTSFDKAIEFKSDYHEAWNNRGSALGDLGRFKEAISFYNEAIKIKPDKHEAWNNRGGALKNLGQIEGAIASFDKAIEIKPDFHEAWINRGVAAGSINSYLSPFAPTAITLQNPTLNQRGYQGQLASLEVGLQYVMEDKNPQGWGLLHHAIGTAHYFQRRNETRRFTELCHEAINSYDCALETLTQEGFPEEHLDVLQDYIKVFLSLRKTPEARQLQRESTELLRCLLAKTKNPAKQKQLKVKLARFQQFTVDIAVQIGNWCAALELAEQGKNTCLSWLFSNESSPKYPEIQQLLNPTTTVVYWHLSRYALHTFIIKSGESTPIVIKSETDSLTHVDKFEEWVKKWNQEYAKGKGEKQEGGAQTWRDNLEETLKELGNILNIAAIEERVRGIKNLILIPHRDLHRFPIHALFGDEFIVSYLPSAKIGINLLKANHLDNQPQTSPININSNASPQPIAKTVLSLENPHSTFKDGDREKRFPSLPAADIESEMICQMFANSNRIGENEATRDRVITELQQPHNILHFTGHGSYEFFDPKKSALFLSGSDRLTVQEIIGIDLSNYELVCLSACETAVTGNQTITTEYVGLVSAFMGAKAKYVLSTLWPVESAASALLVVYFYQQLQAGHREATALAIAQKWLRDATREDLAAWYQAEIDKSPRPTLRRFFSSSKDAIATIELNQPYQHPYYWAAFTLTGL
ncbi:CHAT domain-containing protein [Phormidium nigroviride]